MVLKILQWNLNGFFNNLHELQLLINENRPDIIALQETHLRPNQPNLAHLTNYDSYFANHTSTNRAKGGVALFIKNTIAHKLIPTPNNIQALAVEISLQIKITILSTYFPPSESLTLPKLSSLFSNINTHVLFLGDFNAHSTLWGSPHTDNRGKTIETFFLQTNLSLLNDGSPTHLSTHTTLTHIDLSLASSSLFPSLNWNIKTHPHGSDHFPITITLQDRSAIPTHTPIKVKRKRFKIDEANWTKFQNILNHTLTTDNVSHNTNKEAAIFHKKVIAAANASIPHTSSCIPSHKTVHWWNPKLSNLRSNKQNLFHHFKNNPTKDNLMAYKKSNALFRREVKLSKRESFANFTSAINPNSPIKQIWNNVNRLYGKTKHFTINHIISNNNVKLSDKNEIANYFAEEWSSNSNDSNFTTTFRNLKNNAYGRTNSTTNSAALLIESEITLIELNSALNGTKGKTPGFDNISYPMLKHLPTGAKIHLLKLFNTIFTTSIIPQEWKTATVIPLLKPDKPSNQLTSYRPVSLLPCASKLLEKIIAKRLSWYLNRNNLLSENQVAFKAAKGTIDALLFLDHQIANALSTKQHISLFSIDFHKAFDRVGCHTIIEQLLEWKTGNKIINYVKSFLSNRKFRVRLNTTHSRPFPLFNGIPQGSPLSVVLFQIAFESLNQVIKKHKFFKHCIYADDLYITAKYKDEQLLHMKTDALFTDMNSWGEASGAIISTEKSKVLHICRKRNCNPINFTLNSNPLQFVNNLKILGITFNHKYNWSSHVEYVKISLVKRLNLIKCITSYHSNAHPMITLRLVKALIASKIDYGLGLYGHTSKENIRKINTVYNAAARYSINAFRSTPIPNILTEAGLPTIQQRVKSATRKLIPKIIIPIDSFLPKQSYKQRATKVASCLQHIAQEALNLGLITKPLPVHKPRQPPWKLNSHSIIDTLTSLPKDSTSPEAYTATFRECVAKFSNWNLYYTDGSKNEKGVGYALIGPSYNTIRIAHLASHCSIFTAESEAVLYAVNMCKTLKGKHIICTDSLSTIKAVQNTSNMYTTISKIRDTLIAHTHKIKLMWIPGHVGLTGNVAADTSAKFATRAPVTFHLTFNPTDFAKELARVCATEQKESWNNYTHYYKQFNPDGKAATYPTDCQRIHIQKYVRLRLGHSLFTHQHLMENSAAPQCPLCNCQTISMKHLLVECSVLKHYNTHNNTLINMLSNINKNNIKNIISILKRANIYCSI